MHRSVPAPHLHIGGAEGFGDIILGEPPALLIVAFFCALHENDVIRRRVLTVVDRCTRVKKIHFMLPGVCMVFFQSFRSPEEVCAARLAKRFSVLDLPHFEHRFPIGRQFMNIRQGSLNFNLAIHHYQCAVQVAIPPAAS